MQTFKRISAVLLTVVILVLSLPVTTVFAADTDMRYGREQLGKMSNGDNLVVVYDLLVDGCSNLENRVSIPDKITISYEEMTTIYTMFYSDYPEFFWVLAGSPGYSLMSGKIIAIEPIYDDDVTISNIDTMKTQFNNKVNELTSGLNGKSDYEKSKILHDRLCNTTKYIFGSHNQCAYGALVEGDAVCNGYAKAYQYLLKKAGIPAWFIRGTSNNPSTNKSEGHAWNLVKLDGQWYYTDVTWDDQGDNTFYSYFNITTKQLLEDHSFDDLYASLVPNASATTANYYIKEGRDFSSFDKTKLVNLFKKDNNTSQIYISGNIESFESQFKNNAESIAISLGATGGYGYSITSLGRAMIISFTVISSGHTHSAKSTVSQVSATCLTNGTKSHYVCECGLKFLDKACTQQVTNDSQLEIKASAHTPSNWKNDAANHWKECTKCGSETVNTRSAHSDNNKDNKCDACSYALPVADANGNVTISGGGSENSNSNYTQTSSDNSNTSSINSNVTAETESTVSAEETENSESENVITDEPASNYDESYLYTGVKPSSNILKWILICSGVAILIATSVAVTVILIKKNK